MIEGAEEELQQGVVGAETAVGGISIELVPDKGRVGPDETGNVAVVGRAVDDSAVVAETFVVVEPGTSYSAFEEIDGFDVLQVGEGEVNLPTSQEVVGVTVVMVVCKPAGPLLGNYP